MNKVIQMILGVISMIAPQLKKEDSTEGIKETKEMLIGVNEVSLSLCEKLKDGIQFQDGVEFYNELTKDEEFKAKVIAAYDGRQKIPAEVKDVDTGEGLELVAVQLEYMPKYVETFKKG